MSYIVVGLFPSQMEADRVLLKLENAGYNDYMMSDSHQEISQNVDIEKKIGFWSWLFEDNHFEQARFEYASIDHNMVTVYVKTELDAHTVKDILDKNGAVNVEEKTKEYMSENYSTSPKEYLISENRNSKIIAKARNNLFFTNDRKPHPKHEKTIASEIDSLGYKF